MTRLIVLILPLLVIWISFSSSVEEENEFVGGSHDDREATGSHERGGQIVSESSGAGERPVSDRKGIVGRLRNTGEGARAIADLDGDSSGLADLIFEKIDPGLINDLNRDEVAMLRSYVGRLSSPLVKDQPWLCWAPDVSPAKAAAFHEAERLTGLAGRGYALFANQFLSSGRWARTAVNGSARRDQGDPVTITWSIVPDGTSTPGLDGQFNSSSNFRSWMAGIYGGSSSGPAEDQPWFDIFENAFGAMADTCGVTLRYEPNDDGASISSFTLGSVGVRGDVRISARALDGNSGTLAFAFAPDHGDIIFDSSDGTFDLISGSSIRLFNTAAHEFGHSLGLAHVCPINGTKLLEPILNTSFRGPRFDEHQSLQRLYGDRFESDGASADNDSFSDATELEFPLLETVFLQRLSIDDNTDLDYYRFEAIGGRRLTVSLDPGEGSYREGEETRSGCSSGSNFDSDAIHDLSLAILDQNGSSILASSSSGGEGDREQISLFEFPEDGTYFLRVTGDTSNAAQLYELEARMNDRIPGPHLEAGEVVVLEESGSVENNRLDPNETVRVSIPIQNNGSRPAVDVQTNFEVTDGVTLYSSEFPGRVEVGGTEELVLVFSAVGECGDVAVLSIDFTDESGSLLQLEQDFRLGIRELPVSIDEGFDVSSELPDGWESEEIGGGEAWVAVSQRSVSPIRSVHTGGVGSSSEASLISPSFELASGGGVLSFEHVYRTEISYDGAVLEVSRNGGAWTDLIEDPEVEVTGGYDRAIRTGFGSAIAGQMAWSAKLETFVTTTVELPEAWGGDILRFRWRLVHDRSSFSDGWWVDDVKVAMVVEDCEVHRPALELSLAAGGLDENFPSETAELLISSKLPLASPVVVELGSSGLASSDDFQGDLEVILPAGQSEVRFPLVVRSDELVEGDESLILTIPGDVPTYAAGDDASETIVIKDRINLNTWLAGFFPEAVDPAGDSDGDGMSELAEYLLGTDPTDPSSSKRLSIVRSGEGFLVPLGELPERDDAGIGIEFSSDLKTWVEGAFDAREDGLLIESTTGGVFVRLTFSVIR